MIVCQYDISKLNLNTINDVMKYINEKVDDKETVIAVPSGLSIAEFSDEDGIEVLEKLYRFLGKCITKMKDDGEVTTGEVSKAIEYLNNYECYSGYQEAWATVCEYYGIE